MPTDLQSVPFNHSGIPPHKHPLRYTPKVTGTIENSRIKSTEKESFLTIKAIFFGVAENADLLPPVKRNISNAMSRSKPANPRMKKSRATSGNASRPGARAPQGGKASHGQESWLYGDHAVLAALANPRRKLRRLVMTRAKFDAFDPDLQGHIQSLIAPEFFDKDALAALLPENAIHQGIALLPAPLAEPAIEDLPGAEETEPAVVAVLDQVSDPQNVGAILRSAAAFNVKALIVPDRHSPPVTGVLAKAASGALETVPVIRVGNLSRALDQLADRGYWRIGLDGKADKSLEVAAKGLQKVALVLGSEGRGLRHLTAEKCDLLAKLPIGPQIESLNVSNAAAIAFYELDRPGRIS